MSYMLEFDFTNLNLIKIQSCVLILLFLLSDLACIVLINLLMSLINHKIKNTNPMLHVYESTIM